MRAEAHANGIRQAIGDDWMGRGNSIENGGCVVGDLGGSKTETCRDLGIDLEIRGRPADGVIDSVLHVHDAVDLRDCVGHVWRRLTQQGLVRGKQLDLDRLGRIGEIVDVVLQLLDQLDVKFRLRRLDLVADFAHHVPDRAAAIGF